MEAALRAVEDERAILRDGERCLNDRILDLEKSYAIAMDLVKCAPKEALLAVAATCRWVATQNDCPNTRDLVTAILQGAGSFPDY